MVGDVGEGSLLSFLEKKPKSNSNFKECVSFHLTVSPLDAYFQELEIVSLTFALLTLLFT